MAVAGGVLNAAGGAAETAAAAVADGTAAQEQQHQEGRGDGLSENEIAARLHSC